MIRNDASTVMLGLIALLTVLALTDGTWAMNDPVTGRWITRDPQGYAPTRLLTPSVSSSELARGPIADRSRGGPRPFQGAASDTSAASCEPNTDLLGCGSTTAAPQEALHHDGPNLFSFARCAPTLYIDPTGLGSAAYSCTCFGGVGVAWGRCTCKGATNSEVFLAADACCWPCCVVGVMCVYLNAPQQICMQACVQRILRKSLNDPSISCTCK